MDWQQPVAFLLVAIALAYLGWRTFRRRPPWQRAGSCCAGGSPGSRPNTTVTLHARKGERPEFHVRSQ